MNTVVRLRLIVGLLSVSVLCTARCLADTRAVAAEAITSSHVTSSAQALQRYKTSHSLVDLEAATVAMEGSVDVELLTPENFIATRRNFVEGYATLLAAIERAYEPNYNPYDPKNMPDVCVQPPREPDGRMQPPCSDPNEVRDIRTREQYIAAIKANEIRREQARRYISILHLDERAMGILRLELGVFRDIAPEGVSADYAAIDSILQRAGLSSARRAKIDAMLYTRPEP